MKYHYDVTGPDTNIIQKAFNYCLNETANKTIKEFTLALNIKDQLDSSSIKDALGLSICKKFKKSNSVVLFGVTINLITKNIKPHSNNGLVLAIHPSTDYINNLISCGYYSDSVYIPWTQNELNEYLQNHQSTLL